MKTLASLSCTVLLFAISGCSSEDEGDPIDPTILTIQTDEPSNITQTSAVLGGKILSAGSEPILETGVVIGLSANPDISDPDDLSFVIDAVGNVFSSEFTGFEPGTTVHIRAYALTASQMVYGTNKVFTTLSGCLTELVTTNNLPVNISSPTTWTNDRIYVLTANVTVTSTLTIEPGTIIKMANAQLRVNGNGAINAVGTSDERITFTSLSDDSYCGDTNGDGAATSPQKGDWYNVFLNDGNNTFKYCDFLYAGKNDGGYYNCITISVAGPAFEFDHCVFAHTLSNASADTAFAFFGGSYMSDPQISKFTNNAFYDNDRPIYLNIYYNVNPNNSFHNPANSAQTNARNGIWTYNTTNQGATANFNVSEVPYVLTAFFNGGGSGATDTVNIGAGAILKFLGDQSGISRSTTRQVNIDASAILTSYKDDAHGGDTNGDGNATAPADFDWDGYYNYDNTTYLGGANIFYDSH